MICSSGGMMRTSVISRNPGRVMRFVPPPKSGFSTASVAASSSFDIARSGRTSGPPRAGRHAEKKIKYWVCVLRAAGPAFFAVAMTSVSAGDEARATKVPEVMEPDRGWEVVAHNKSI
eukprot:scaffold3334_cov139-Isochrysis_galbana.AAC.3